MQGKMLGIIFQQLRIQGMSKGSIRGRSAKWELTSGSNVIWMWDNRILR